MFASRHAIAKATMPIIAGMVSAFFVISEATAAEKITVCSAKGAGASQGAGKGFLQLSRLLALPAEDIDAGNDTIALTQDEQGFDLILNWHQQDEHSLRAGGVDILGTALGNLIHVMVAGGQDRIEHYLFNLDEDGSGDLLWDAGASQRQNDSSASFACTKPR